MVSLGTRILLETSAGALVAAARNDVAAAHLAYEMGYECVKVGTIQRNFPCDLIACRRDRVRPPHNEAAARFTENLWLQRHDLRSGPGDLTSIPSAA